MGDYIGYIYYLLVIVDFIYEILNFLGFISLRVENIIEWILNFIFWLLWVSFVYEGFLGGFKVI